MGAVIAIKDVNDLLLARGREGALAAIEEAEQRAVKVAPPLQTDSERTITSFQPTGLTLDALMKKELPTPNWAVEGLIPEGFTLIGGKQKMGKSWLGYDMSIAVANGEDFINLPARRGEVLYLALEDNEYRLQERGNKLLRNRQTPTGLHLEISWPRFDEGGDTALDVWLEMHPRCRMVLVDTYAVIKPKSARGVNAYEDEYNASRRFKALADKHHVSIVAVTHLRKAGADDWMDTFNASTGLTAAADCVIQLARERGRADAVLNCDGRAIPRPLTLAMNFDKETARWTNMGDAVEARLPDTQAAIVRVLKAARQPLAPSEVHELLAAAGAEYKEDNIRQTMRRMFDAGTITSTSGGKYMAVLQILSLLSLAHKGSHSEYKLE